jgi:predicted nucleotidyltransferase
MRRIVSDDQIQDLIELNNAAVQFHTQIVIIGAVALACFLRDLGRFTSDVDLVVALDLHDFEAFMSMLRLADWRQEKNREHRWRSPRGSIVDLLPAGPKLRGAKQIVWPISQFTMSLVGFEHVFARAVKVELAPGIRFDVAPLAVVALLKIVAHLDDPYRRAKDLHDLKFLLSRYEESTNRIFCDEVFAAELEDIGQATAFLLGLDLHTIATAEEQVVISRFITRYRTDDFSPDEDRAQAQFQLHLRAFEKGISGK